MTRYENDPIANDARRARRREHLGSTPICLLCSYDTFDAIIPVARTLLEQHHVVARVNDDTLTVPLCRNCHAVVTERQKDMGIVMSHQQHRHVLEKLIDILRCVGDFLISLGERLIDYAEQLMHVVETLTLVLQWGASCTRRGVLETVVR